MAFGTSSAVFEEFIRSALGAAQTADVLPSTWAGLPADTVRVALYGNTGTPNKNDTRANSAYNAGQWVTANQSGATDANWLAAGIALTSKTLTASSGVVKFDAADTTHTGTVTFTDVRGCLVYDDTVAAGTGGVADLGVCFNSFGGSVAVTAGTFTIVWSASGIFTVTMT